MSSNITPSSDLTVHPMEIESPRNGRKQTQSKKEGTFFGRIVSISDCATAPLKEWAQLVTNSMKFCINFAHNEKAANKWELKTPYVTTLDPTDLSEQAYGPSDMRQFIFGTPLYQTTQDIETTWSAGQYSSALKSICYLPVQFILKGAALAFCSLGYVRTDIVDAEHERIEDQATQKKLNLISRQLNNTDFSQLSSQKSALEQIVTNCNTAFKGIQHLKQIKKELTVSNPGLDRQIDHFSETLKTAINKLHQAIPSQNASSVPTIQETKTLSDAIMLYVNELKIESLSSQIQNMLALDYRSLSQQPPDMKAITAYFKNAVETLDSLKQMQNELISINPNLNNDIASFTIPLNKGIINLYQTISSQSNKSCQDIAQSSEYKKGLSLLNLGFEKLGNFYESLNGHTEL